MVDVRGPDGIITRFPDGTPDATINQVMTAAYAPKPKAEKPAGFFRNMRALGDRTNNALLFGLDDDLAGVEGVIGNAVRAPFDSKTDFDPRGAFNRRKGEYQAESARVEREMPNATRLADVTGFLGSLAAAVANVGRAQTLGLVCLSGDASS